MLLPSFRSQRISYLGGIFKPMLYRLCKTVKYIWLLQRYSKIFRIQFLTIRTNNFLISSLDRFSNVIFFKGWNKARSFCTKYIYIYSIALYEIFWIQFLMIRTNNFLISSLDRFSNIFFLGMKQDSIFLYERNCIENWRNNDGSCAIYYILYIYEI